MFKPNIVVLAAAGAMLAACRYNGYKINGNSHNLDNGDTVYITRCLDTGQHIDTAIVHEGRFTAEGTVDSTVFCLVYCPKQPKLTMPFFLEHGTIRMRLSDRPAQAYVSGTANNDKWQSLMAETVSSIAEHIPVYIVSNCEKGYTELFLDKTGMRDIFKGWLCFGDTGLDKDRTIAMLMDNCGLKKSCYVGDIKNDALCSKRAGIPFIWASYGFGGVPEELFYRKINDIRELKDIFIG